MNAQPQAARLKAISSAYRAMTLALVLPGSTFRNARNKKVIVFLLGGVQRSDEGWKIQ
jgi:predicted SPOUT superfamily RNA methylase MTH1